MRVIRHYFISNDLDDLEVVQQQLEGEGLTKPQIHVLSLDDMAVENHHRLHDVSSFMKTDVLRSGEIGLLVGLAIAAALLLIAYFAGWTAAPVGWLPFVLLAAIVLGFATWEGGFIGIQRRNTHFARFEKALADGNHVFFVDVEPGQEDILDAVISPRQGIAMAGTEKGTPHWVLEGQKRIPRMLQNI